MLVLSRKQEEKIILRVGDEEITLTVVRIDASKVRLGIDASKEVAILRSELVDNPKVALTQ